MIDGRCLLCDEPARPGETRCALHARRWSPDHAGRPPERIRAMRRRIAATALNVERLPWWLRRARARYGLEG